VTLIGSPRRSALCRNNRSPPKAGTHHLEPPRALHFSMVTVGRDPQQGGPGERFTEASSLTRLWEKRLPDPVLPRGPGPVTSRRPLRAERDAFRRPRGATGFGQTPSGAPRPARGEGGPRRELFRQQRPPTLPGP
jgi:hypothetical protein